MNPGEIADFGNVAEVEIDMEHAPVGTVLVKHELKADGAPFVNGESIDVTDAIAEGFGDDGLEFLERTESILDFLERSHESAVAVTTKMRAETAELKKARAERRKPPTEGRD